MKAQGIIILTILFIIFLSFGLLAQAPDTLWTRTYGGSNYDYGRSVKQTHDDGYIIVGSTWSFGAGSYDIYFIKTNEYGDTMWTKTYGGSASDFGGDVLQTYDKGYIAVGNAWSGSYLIIIRTDSLGDSLWTKSYDGLNNATGFSIQQTTDSCYIIAGETSITAAGGENVYLLKTDLNGDTLWTRIFDGGTDYDRAYQVQECKLNGGYIVVGRTGSPYSDSGDVYVIRTNNFGDSLWTKKLGGQFADYARSVQQTTDGGFIITGTTNSYGQGTPGCSNVYILKIDSIGVLEWQKTYGSTSPDEGYYITTTNDGNYAIVGFKWTFNIGEYDTYLLKINPNGDTLWTKTYGGPDDEEGYALLQASDDCFIIVGITESFGAGGYDVYLIKTEPDVGIKESEKGIHKYMAEIQLNIAPNPFTTITRIELLGVRKNSKNNLTIYDSAGRLVKSVKLETSTYELGADLLPGIYFLKLNGKPIGKVVKVR